MSFVKKILPVNNQVHFKKLNGSNDDIIAAILKSKPMADKQISEVASWFDEGNEFLTCRKIYTFLRENVPYIADQNEQVIKMPGILLAQGGDCKSFSLFASAVLSALKINHKMRFVSYDANPMPSHVYVLTNSGIIVDGTIDLFNFEKKFTFKKDYPMDIKIISGVMPHNIAIMGTSISDIKNIIYSRTAAKANLLLSGPLLASRSAFRVLMNQNVLGLATLMQATLNYGGNDAVSSFKNAWYRVGGEKDANKVLADIKTGYGRNRKLTLANINAIEKYLAEIKLSSGISSPEAAGAGATLPVWVSIIIALGPTIALVLATMKQGTKDDNYVVVEPPKTEPTQSNTGLLMALAAAALFLFK